jgi:hypothetical protein
MEHSVHPHEIVDISHFLSRVFNPWGHDAHQNTHPISHDGAEHF